MVTTIEDIKEFKKFYRKNKCIEEFLKFKKIHKKEQIILCSINFKYLGFIRIYCDETWVNMEKLAEYQEKEKMTLEDIDELTFY